MNNGLKISLYGLMISGGVFLYGEESEVVSLGSQDVPVYQVAHQESSTGLTTPVTEMRFQPQLDLQSRNYIEGQSDIIIRGGTFENTGLSVGGVSLKDPQTGHYLGELPIAPDFLGPLHIHTGVDNALNGFNSTAGSVSWDWKRIETEGNARLIRGQYRYRSAAVYQGLVLQETETMRWGIDGGVGFSRGDGTRAWGDHRMDRYNARTQLVTVEAQTDLFYGYQSKFFGWPNLYTPFNRNETDNLQTTLVMLTHRRWEGLIKEVTLFYRELRDEYQFDRFQPSKAYQHETEVYGASVRLGREIGAWYWESVHGMNVDSINSTSMGKSGREYFKNALLIGRLWQGEGEQQYRTEVGVNWEASSNDYGKVYPLLRARWYPHGEAGPQGYAEFSGTSQLADYTALNSSPTAGLFRGNPNLQRERSINVETGWIQPTSLGEVRGALFYRRDRGLVDWTFSNATPNARSANPVDIDVWGLELFWVGRWERVQWSAGYTYLRKFSDYHASGIDGSFYALNYPRHRFTISARVDLGHDVALNLDQQFRWQSYNPLRVEGGRSSWYGLASLSWQVPWVEGLELEAGIDNLWNTQFQEIPQVPYSSRQYFVSVRYSW
jgi:vitamin B12 transporter